VSFFAFGHCDGVLGDSNFILNFFLLVSTLAKDYGLFLADEDPKKGIWLEPGRNLGYYMLRTGVSISSRNTF
jgi:N-terminal or F0 domain of Talin-head FERM